MNKKWTLSESNKYIGKKCAKCGSKSRYHKNNQCVVCCSVKMSTRGIGINKEVKVDMEATMRRRAIEDHQLRRQENELC